MGHTYSCCNPHCHQSFGTADARDQHEQNCEVPAAPLPPDWNDDDDDND